MEEWGVPASRRGCVSPHQWVLSVGGLLAKEPCVPTTVGTSLSGGAVGGWTCGWAAGTPTLQEDPGPGLPVNGESVLRFVDEHVCRFPILWMRTLRLRNSLSMVTGRSGGGAGLLALGQGPEMTRIVWTLLKHSFPTAAFEVLEPPAQRSQVSARAVHVGREAGVLDIVCSFIRQLSSDRVPLRELEMDGGDWEASAWPSWLPLVGEWTVASDAGDARDETKCDRAWGGCSGRELRRSLRGADTWAET